MKNHIIGIAGADQAGKTTLARQLDRRLESLANPIYLELIKEKRLGFTVEELKASPEKVKYRELLRAIGKAKRDKREDYWVEKLLKKIDKTLNTLFVIDDVRYKNEAEAIQERGGFLVYLDRPITPKEKKYDSFKELNTVKEMADLIMIARAYPPEKMAEILNKEMASYYLDKTLSFMSDHTLDELIEIANNK